MYISDPQLGFHTRMKLYSAAKHDAKAGIPELDANGYLNTNTVRALAAKANEAAKNEASRYNGKKYSKLRKLYSNYEAILASLKSTYTEFNKTISKIACTRLSEDNALDESAMKERIAARSVKPTHKYNEKVNQLTKKLEQMAAEANDKYDLAGYESLRLAAKTHCEISIQHHYYWPAELYARSLCHELNTTKFFVVPPLETTWHEDLDQILPKLNFSQHNEL